MPGGALARGRGDRITAAWVSASVASYSDMPRSTAASPEVQEMIDELAANSAELSRLLHETVSALGELVSGASPTAADGAPPPVPGSGPLGPDLLEIATLQAEAEGVRVEDWLREAILTHAARDGAGPTPRNEAARARRARGEAARVRTESAAVSAETSRATARAADLGVQAATAPRGPRGGAKGTGRTRPG